MLNNIIQRTCCSKCHDCTFFLLTLNFMTPWYYIGYGRYKTNFLHVIFIRIFKHLWSFGEFERHSTHLSDITHIWATKHTFERHSIHLSDICIAHDIAHIWGDIARLISYNMNNDYLWWFTAYLLRIPSVVHQQPSTGPGDLQHPRGWQSSTQRHMSTPACNISCKKIKRLCFLERIWNRRGSNLSSVFQERAGRGMCVQNDVRRNPSQGKEWTDGSSWSHEWVERTFPMEWFSRLFRFQTD